MELDVTRERIRQMEKKAIDKLKIGKTDGLVNALYASITDEMKARGGFMLIAQIRKPVMNLTGVGEIDIDSAISLLLFLKPNQFVRMPKKCWGLKSVPLNLVIPVTERLIKILQAARVPLTQADLKACLIRSKLYVEDKLYTEDELEQLISASFIEACLSTDNRFEKTGNNEWELTKWRRPKT